jgi:leucyl aminopeptidase
VQIKLTARSKWQGKTTVVPAFAGSCPKLDAGGVSLDGLRIGAEEGETTVVRADDRQAVLFSLGDRDKCVTDTFRRAGGRIARWADQREVGSAGIDTAAVETGGVEGWLAALTEGLVLGGFRFDEHKSAAKKRPTLELELLVKRATKTEARQVDRAVRAAEAANLAREIAHQPPNVINPVTLAERVKKLAAACDLKCRVLDEKQLKRLKMGAILAVGQGSDTPPRLIVLEYPGRRGGKPVVLVGKAITFDTGGYSIKTKDGILGMKYDKCGAMAVLGAMAAVAALRPSAAVVGVIAAAENMVSGGAYRPDDMRCPDLCPEGVSASGHHRPGHADRRSGGGSGQADGRPVLQSRCPG